MTIRAFSIVQFSISEVPGKELAHTAANRKMKTTNQTLPDLSKHCSELLFYITMIIRL